MNYYYFILFELETNGVIYFNMLVILFHRKLIKIII